MNAPIRFDTVEDIKRYHRGHWFSSGAMRFFRSRVGENVYQGPGGIFFVSSEQFDDSTPRRYTVRRYDPTADNIGTIGEFNKLSRASAIREAKRLAKGE